MDTAVHIEKLAKRMPHSERVYLAMRDELMSGRVSPFHRLGEERMSEKFAVSRTPVREALARLTADGLIEKRDGGFFMYMASFNEMVDYYEVRILLELRGFDRVLENPDLKRDHAALAAEVDWWRNLQSNIPTPEAGFVANDERFHTALLGSAGNAALTSSLRQVNQRIRPVRMFDYMNEDRMLATITEHIAIGELALSDDMPGAKAALREHIGESRDVVMARVSASLLLASDATNVTRGR